MNRRDFLRPRRLAQTAGQLLGPLYQLKAPLPPPPDSEVTLLRFARPAMATTFELLMPFGQPHAAEAANACHDTIDRLEAQLTVYRDDSEVSQLNRTAAESAVVVEEGLFGLLRTAAELSAATGGSFDVTAGPLIKAWGFYRRQGCIPDEAERAEALRRVGMRYVALNATERSVRFHRPGLEINLGSIGKGYALDRVAHLLAAEWNVEAALVHGGGSSVFALGAQPGEPRGWLVGVRHPWDPERRLGILRLRDRALATSAATFQYLEANGRKFGHLLDPRTGRPAEGVASATAVAPTAAEADALATAFYVDGLAGARAYCRRHPNVGAVVLPDEPDAELAVLNLTPDEFTPDPPTRFRRELLGETA